VGPESNLGPRLQVRIQWLPFRSIDWFIHTHRNPSSVNYVRQWKFRAVNSTWLSTPREIRDGRMNSCARK